MLEIEKTFLVKTIPTSLTSYKSFKIKQGYLSSSSAALRIRQKGDKYEFTKKIQLDINDKSTYEETNIFLTEEEFNKLWPFVEKSLEKTRYLIPLENNLTAELDIYSGALTGFAVVEVEFPDRESMDAFVAPDWFGPDITQKDFSSNFFLAGKSYQDIANYL